MKNSGIELSVDGKQITLENVRLVYRNFEGREGQYNRAGSRNFKVVLDEKTGQALADMGFNVRVNPPREEGDDPFITMKVLVSYRFKKPIVKQITANGMTRLGENELFSLDTAAIQTADVIFTGSHYDYNGGGTAAYLDKLIVTIKEDRLDEKYRQYEVGPDEEDEPF